MAVKIIVDTAADFELAELEEKDIDLVPIPITFGEETFLDTVELSKDEFYKRLLEGTHFPKTSQPSPEAYVERFNKIKEAGDSAVVITLSSGLSGTYQGVLLAKEISGCEDIYVVDSRQAACGIRIIVEQAVKLRDGGADARSIAEEITSLRERVTLFALIDTLEYLYRGGRLTKAQARLGTLANLKPVVTVSPDGTVAVRDKALGRAQGLSKLLKLVSGIPADTSYPMYPIYSYRQDGCDNMVSKLRELFPGASIEPPTAIGSTIGTHIGDGAIGFVYIRK